MIKMLSKFEKNQEKKEALKWFAQGYWAESQSDYSYALKCYKKAIELEPNSGLHYLNRGNIYKKMGFHSHAIEDFQQAVSLDPKLKRAVLHANSRAS